MSRSSLSRLLPLLLGLSLVAQVPALADDEEEPPPEKPNTEEEDLRKEEKEVHLALDAALAEEANLFSTKNYDELPKKLDTLLTGIGSLKVRQELKDERAAGVHYDYACLHSIQGKKDDAQKSLVRAFELGFCDWKHVGEDEDLENVKKEPWFEKSIETAKEAQRQKGAALVKKALGEKPVCDLDFDLKTIDGKALKLKDLKGKAVIVLVFASGSQPSLEQIPTMVKLHESYASKGLEIVGVCCEILREDVEKDVAKFASRKGIKFPLAVCDRDEAPKKYVPGFAAFPTALYLDRDGKVRLKEWGFAPSRAPYERFEGVVKALLDSSGQGK